MVLAAYLDGAPRESDFRVEEAELPELAEGQVFLGFIRDISDRRALEDQLAASEAWARRVIADANQAIVCMDAFGRVLEWNQDRMLADAMALRCCAALHAEVRSGEAPRTPRPPPLVGMVGLWLWLKMIALCAITPSLMKPECTTPPPSPELRLPQTQLSFNR